MEQVVEGVRNGFTWPTAREQVNGTQNTTATSKENTMPTYLPNVNPHLWLASITVRHGDDGEPVQQARLHRLLGWDANTGAPVVLFNTGLAVTLFSGIRRQVLEGDEGTVADLFDAWRASLPEAPLAAPEAPKPAEAKVYCL